jgi:anaerobic ribonucleoside-triphosphate reductase activating protein
MDSSELSNHFRYAGLDECEFVNGDGVGATIYFQGCTHRCPGCHNPQTWDSEGGMLFGISELQKVQAWLADEHIQRITLSGGDPFDNIEMLAYLLSYIGLHNISGKKIWVYTGYTFEELVAHGYEHLLAQIDYLVDGRYIQEMRDLSIAFRGSSNQRIIDSKASVKNKKIKTVDLDTEEGK